MARWISGIVLTAVVLTILFYAPQAAQYVVAVLSVVAAWEFFDIVSANRLNRALALLVTAIGVSRIIFDFNATTVLATVYMIFTYAFIVQMFDKTTENDKRVAQAALFALGVLYVTISFGFLGRIFTLPNYRFWVFMALACTFLGDTVAYLFGRAWGKTKLAPSISPGKTQAGLAGGLLGGALGGLGVKFLFGPDFPLALALPLGVMTSLMGVVGDLSESLLKRGFNVKDSGKIIPGHGGILDRVDGLLFTAPFVYLVAHWYYS